MIQTLSRDEYFEFLARVFVSSIPQPNELYRQISVGFGRHIWQLKPTCVAYASEFSNRVRPRRRFVKAWLRKQSDAKRAYQDQTLYNSGNELPEKILPISQFQSLGESLPAITTKSELAKWLQVSLANLDWFADLGNRNRIGRDSNLRFLVRLQPKKNGRMRILEIPNSKLAFVQRRILEEILYQVPLNESVHGFRRNRSILSYASSHFCKSIVLKMDLRDFFPSITFAKIAYQFRAIGFPEIVADYFAGLCTNSISVSNEFAKVEKFEKHDRNSYRKYEQRHLPQGAPASPALANLSVWRLDKRLQNLSKASDVSYSRYADDLGFSSDSHSKRSMKRFADHVSAIVLEEGLEVNHRKTKIMAKSSSQRLVGIVVNDRPNVNRKYYERLKATLHNCNHSMDVNSQNRNQHPNFREHLLGQITFVKSINRKRGEKLMQMFESISW